MDELDQRLLRVHELCVADITQEVEEEIDGLLPPLVDAGYVLIDGETDSGYFWRFTPKGVERSEALGVFAQLYLRPETAQLIQRMRDELERDGWTITVTEPKPDTRGQEATVEVSHPLTGSGMGYVFLEAVADHTEFVEGALAHREYDVIRARPAECPHASLIQSFRGAARASSWDRAVVAIVARVLRHQGLLTDEEAAWLEEAGPAWWDDEDEERYLSRDTQTDSRRATSDERPSRGVDRNRQTGLGF